MTAATECGEGTPALPACTATLFLDYDGVLHPEYCHRTGSLKACRGWCRCCMAVRGWSGWCPATGGMNAVYPPTGKLSHRTDAC